MDITMVDQTAATDDEDGGRATGTQLLKLLGLTVKVRNPDPMGQETALIIKVEREKDQVRRFVGGHPLPQRWPTQSVYRKVRACARICIRWNMAHRGLTMPGGSKGLLGQASWVAGL